MSLRNYDAANAGRAISGKAFFNVPGYVARVKVNQHATLYDFPDGSRMMIRKSGTWKAWHPKWRGTADDVHLGPDGGAHRANAAS